MNERDMTEDEPSVVAKPPARIAIALALAIIYLVWGSTYLAMRFALETLPPFLLAGTRFVIAGLIAYGWSRWRGADKPDRREILDAFVGGGFLLVGGNGGVVWALLTVPTGLAALVVATVPLWVALLEWLRPGGSRPDGRTILSLVLGLAGVAWLIAPKAEAGGGVPLAGGLVLLFSSLSWSIGSLYIRARARHVRQPFLKGVALQMIVGGMLLLLAALMRGEFAKIQPEHFTGKTLTAMLYLIVAGSLMSYTAYGWLLTVVRPTLVATYAFVNPLVAVLLGYAFGGETLSIEAILAGGMVVASVAFMILAHPGEGRPTTSSHGR